MVVSHLPEIHEYLADRLIWLEKVRSSLLESQEILKRFLAGIGKSEPLAPKRDLGPLIKVRGLFEELPGLHGRGSGCPPDGEPQLRYKQGDITSFIGNSGGGKTTLLKIMQGKHAG